MAKVKSLFEVSGDVGSAGFFRRKGNIYLRRSTSLDANRIKNDPAFRRTRENLKEFSGVAAATQSFRACMGSVIKQFSDDEFANRIYTTMHEVLKADLSVRGRRSIKISAQRPKLRGLNFNKIDVFGSKFREDYQVTVPATRDQAILDIPPFDPANLVTAPTGATHFRIVIAIGTVSDLEHSILEDKYLPVDPGLHRLKAVARSAEFGIDVPVTAPISIALALPGAVLMSASTTLFVSVGIEFYQKIGAAAYLLENGNAMQIHDLY